MTPTFLDTSGLVGIVNTDDRWHPKAEFVWSNLLASSIAIATTSLVLIELADGFSRLRYRETAIQAIEALRRWNKLEIVQSNRTLESTAWQLYRDRPDKEWSMTDCVSMTLTQHGMRDVFTADKHFEQAGFNILLK